MSNTLDSVQIDPSCLDVGFGEVLHAALAGLRRRKLLVGATANDVFGFWMVNKRRL